MLFISVRTTRSVCGTMAKAFLWWSTRWRRSLCQLLSLDSFSPPAIMMMIKRRSQVTYSEHNCFWVRLARHTVSSTFIFLSQVDVMVMVPSFATSLAPSSLWKLHAESPRGLSNRWARLALPCPLPWLFNNFLMKNVSDIFFCAADVV